MSLITLPEIRRTARPNRPADSRQRGTVIILVVAVLAIVVIMGAAFLRSANSNNQAAGITDDRDIDAATQSVIEMIRNRMLADLYGEDGVLLNSDATDGGTSETLDEPYDYPDNAVDAWLASTNAAGIDTDDDGAVDDYGWKHLSWLDQPFLAGSGDEDARSTNAALPTPATPAADADLASNDWADADGDGVADSRWFALPRQLAGDMEFIAAVRVVDLSGMANAGMAMTLLDDNGSYAGVDAQAAPRWAYPVELDVGRMLTDAREALAAPTPDDALADLRSLFRIRRGLDDATDPLPMDRAAREAFWTSGWAEGFPSDTGEAESLSMTSIATVANELELRHRNGLNDATQTASIESLMPNLTRSNASEADFASVNADPEVYLTHEPRHRMTVLSAAAPYYMRETDATGTIVTTPDPPLRLDGNAATAEELVTEVEAVLASNANGASFTIPTSFAVDGALNDQQQRNAYARQIVANLIDAVDVEAGAGSPVTLRAVPDGAGANPRYGLEALPFITEVYRQRTYKAEQWEQETGADDVNGDGTSGDGKWYLMLEQDGDTGYAIELRNPFNRQIDLHGVTLTIGGDGVDDDADGAIDEADEPEVQAITLSDHASEMAADEILILYHNPSDGTPNTDSNIVDAAAPFDDFLNRPADMTLTTSPAGAVAAFEGNDDVKVELRVGVTEDGSTIDKTLAYQAAVTKAIDDSEKQNFVEDGPSDSDPGDENPPIYKQKIVTNFGRSDGINMLTFTAAEFGLPVATSRFPDPPILPVGTDPEQSAPGDFSPPADEIDQLGLTESTTPNRAEPAGGNVPDTDTDGDGVVQIRQNQFVIPVGAGRLDRPALLSMLPIIGPREDQTIAEAWGAAASAEDHMLDLTSGQFAGAGDHALPHALLLLDRFAARRYDLDGIDNDVDQTVDEPDEAMIPGRINLNTVDEQTLSGLMPIPTLNSDPQMGLNDAIARLVIAYRDQLDVSGETGLLGSDAPNYSDRAIEVGPPNWRSRPGIAAIGELFAAFDAVDGAPPGNDGIDSKAWSDPLGLGYDFRIDFTPADAEADQIVDDREEKSMLIRWLAQVATTRSDTFAAYITVRGYNRTIPIAGGDSGYESSYLAARKRVVVFFDRSPALTGDREVAVRAVAEW